MRGPRIKAPGEGFYHVVSRIGGRRFLLDDAEKRSLLALIRRAAAFSGVDVYTYAIMDNHFHLLVRVPRKTEVSDAELERRVVALHGAEHAARIFEKWDAWLRKGKEWRVQVEKQRLRARMHDLSQFCKTFKENYTQSYNRRHGNTGTIWEGRFKSILLEGKDGALMTVAAYIHLNPVRAKTVEKATDAANSGLGAACAGDESAREGLSKLVGRLFIDIDALADWPTARAACMNAIEGKIGAPSAGNRLHCAADSPAPNASPPPSSPAPATIRELLSHRRVGFLHGKVLGTPSYLAENAAKLPPRLRQRPVTCLDAFASLGLTAASGVRDG